MKLSKTKQGFTIIEVMIVLAIAGLILLIVFLAVPAAERAVRNNARKHDATLIIAERAQYDVDSGTQLIIGTATCSPSGGTMSGGGGGTFAGLCGYFSGLSYYQITDITVVDNGYSAPTSFPTPTTDQIYTITYAICNSAGNGATATGATPYDAVVLYALENGDGTADQVCINGGVYTSA